MAEHVHPLSCSVCYLEAEIYVVTLGKELFLVGGKYGKNSTVNNSIAELAEFSQFAVNADNSRSTDGKVNI